VGLGKSYCLVLFKRTNGPFEAENFMRIVLGVGDPPISYDPPQPAVKWVVPGKNGGRQRGDLGDGSKGSGVQRLLDVPLRLRVKRSGVLVPGIENEIRSQAGPGFL